MKKYILLFILFFVFFGVFHIRGNKIKEIAIWDFDGTIIRGDCSEGLNDSKDFFYNGLIKEAILAGLSNQYKGKEGVKHFFDEYDLLLQKGDKKKAYTYVAKIFIGTDEKKLEQFSEHYFNTKIYPFYYSASIENMKNLKGKGIENFIISASLEVFVRGASKTLKIPVDHILGIKVKVENGLMTDEVLEPVPFGEGKVAIMKNIEKDYQAKAMFGFGNSYSTDGPFLFEILKQGGQAVMINGGKPCLENQKNFICVKQEDIIGL